MTRRRSVDTAAWTGSLETLLRKNEFDVDFSKMLLEIFMRVCRTLKVDDASDPLSKTIARTVIVIASEGERDPDILHERTLSRVHN